MKHLWIPKNYRPSACPTEPAFKSLTSIITDRLWVSLGDDKISWLLSKGVAITGLTMDAK